MRAGHTCRLGQVFPSPLHAYRFLCKTIGIGRRRLSVWERFQSWAACIMTIAEVHEFFLR